MPPRGSSYGNGYTSHNHMLSMRQEIGCLRDQLQAAEYIHQQDQRAIHHLAHSHSDECERAWKAEAALADCERELKMLKERSIHLLAHYCKGSGGYGGNIGGGNSELVVDESYARAAENDKTQASNAIKVAFLRLRNRRLESIADGEATLRARVEEKYNYEIWGFTKTVSCQGEKIAAANAELARLRDAHLARALPSPKTWAGSKTPLDELEQLPALESNETPSDDSSDDEFVKVAPEARSCGAW